MTTDAIDVLELTVQVSGGELFVKRWAARSALEQPPVVLLHDSLGCIEMWRDFPRSLALRLRRPVVAYDRLGFGRSSPRQGLPSARFVAEEADTGFPALRTQLKFETFLLFGHSVGGGMAAIIAATFPDTCLAVITESAQAFVEERTLAAIALAKRKFSAPGELAKLERYHGTKARWVVDAWTDTWLSPVFRDWNLRQALSMIRCPLLAIHGDEDEYGSTAFPEAMTRTAGPSVNAVLRRCGHVPHREQASLVLDTVQGFIDQFSLASGADLPTHS